MLALPFFDSILNLFSQLCKGSIDVLFEHVDGLRTLDQFCLKLAIDRVVQKEGWGSFNARGSRIG
jgi:hypothetical protein